MLKIGPPDLHYLTAARGWLELGNPAEATAELLGISQDFENDIAVLEVRWEIHAQQKTGPKPPRFPTTLSGTIQVCLPAGLAAHIACMK